MRALDYQTDEQLLIEAAQRDPHRFADLYEHNFERVYAYIARRVPSREEAQDLTAEVFHQALANLGKFEWRGVPFFTGIFTTVIQFLAGVGGLFLDIFFNKSGLDRKTTNATKAITQTFSHVLRGAYFGSLAGVGDLKFVVWGPGIVLALVGAIAAPFVLERMTDHGFRQWTRGIIFTIAVIYLIRGGLLLWRGF